uniref:Uncharacterized protein n=2 Tax=Proboscia inermis TaxID=420281 RepID=A0A7S0CE60_9STRA|mmetsp:Transcript_39991/g.40631  ORF Transcript_39991/g.40631 Transcript_39991/m.40631 type:complete len:106 (+) Transcript_39991:341-658(+)
MGRLQYYNQKSFVDRTTDGCETMNLARKCIIDVLSVDVRSAWQERKLLERAVSTQQIDNVLVYFSVSNTPSTNSNSSIFNDVDETEGTEFVEILKIQETTWNDAK